MRVCLLVEGRGSRVNSRGSRVNGRGSMVTSRGSKNSSQLFLNVVKSKFRVYLSFRFLIYVHIYLRGYAREQIPRDICARFGRYLCSWATNTTYKPRARSLQGSLRQPWCIDVSLAYGKAANLVTFTVCFLSVFFCLRRSSAISFPKYEKFPRHIIIFETSCMQLIYLS